jgi:hypothetical protein
MVGGCEKVPTSPSFIPLILSLLFPFSLQNCSSASFDGHLCRPRQVVADEDIGDKPLQRGVLILNNDFVRLAEKSM